MRGSTSAETGADRIQFGGFMESNLSTAPALNKGNLAAAAAVIAPGGALHPGQSNLRSQMFR